MLKIGVLGAGHLGKIHLKCIKQIDKYELVGFFDPNEAVAKQVSEEFGIPCFESMQSLMESVDVVDIVTPTTHHFECIEAALKLHKHIFVEKPVVATMEEANILKKEAETIGVKMQVGHVERFNPAFVSAAPYITKPKFIEVHRLAVFNPRGTDVPVELDLMIHDLDILLSIVKSEVSHISASGVAIVSPTADIANARVEFKNGTVANITSSRLSMKNMRKMRIFQNDAYIAVDFLEKSTDIVRLSDSGNPQNPLSFPIDLPNGTHKHLSFEKPDCPATNAIQEELSTFADAINNDTQPKVTLSDGIKALDLAYKIMAAVDESVKRVVDC